MTPTLNGRRAAAVLAFACTMALGSADPALAGPDKATRDARARQLPSGGTVEASVRVGEHQPEGPGEDTPGGIGESTGLVTHYWVEMANQVIRCTHQELGYGLVRHDRSTEPPTVTLVRTACLAPEDAPQTPPPPPDPPTLSELSSLVRDRIDPPVITLSPEAEGFTGLETWFWYDGDDEVSVTATVRGYSVIAAMRPSRFYWETGDPDGELLTSTTAGTKDDPAARWIYETKGDYAIRMQVVWDGTWTYSGNGAAASGSLATVRATSERAYPVGEIRSVLTD